MRPVLVIDDYDDSFSIFPSVTSAARSLNRDVSTIHRALTGDRGCVSTADGKLVVDIAQADKELFDTV